MYPAKPTPAISTNNSHSLDGIGDAHGSTYRSGSSGSTTRAITRNVSAAFTLLIAQPLVGEGVEFSA
jgi:hypothetical protein